MQIDPNSHITPTPRQGVSHGSPRGTVQQGGGASFDQAAQLNQALRQTPEVRPDVVARARLLTGDLKYPPDLTIQRIARLLAIQLGG